MLKGSAAEVNDLAKGLVSQRMFWLLLITIPVVGLPGCAMGITSVMALFVYPHWWQQMFFIAGALIGLSTPLLIPHGLTWLHRIPARSQIHKLMQMEADAIAQCLEVIPQPTYFNATCGLHGGAIAVDPASGKIALVVGEMRPSATVKTRAITLNPGELRGWSAEQAGASTLGLVGAGHSSSDLLSVHQHNVKQHMQQVLGTGLRLVTENLDATEIFINFDYEVAKSWLVLLDKLAGGRLEVPNAAVEFPKS